MHPLLAHLGGVPIQESLIYLVPPVAVVAWIYVLGRRERRNPRPPAEDFEEPADDLPMAPQGERRDGRA